MASPFLCASLPYRTGSWIRIGGSGVGEGGTLEAVVRVKRVYDEPSRDDGRRVLVDRLWPRGVRKDAVVMDEWLREVAPSDELRRWYRHEPGRFAGFARRYRAELAGPEPAEALGRLGRYAEEGPLTLLTASKDVEHSQARVLADVLGGAESVGGSA
jgi:uncharacterized protein YeaO (DUF488 family)